MNQVKLTVIKTLYIILTSFIQMLQMIVTKILAVINANSPEKQLSLEAIQSALQVLVGQQFSSDELLRATQVEDYVAQLLQQQLNTGSGPDLEQLGIEIKTKGRDSVSANTICSMTSEAIVATEYAQSPIAAKMQIQIRVEFDENSIVARVAVYDFTKPIIQALIGQAYEAARQMLIDSGHDWAGEYGYLTPPVKYGIFEKSSTDTSWMFRISVGDMLHLERLAKSNGDQLFGSGFLGDDRPKKSPLKKSKPLIEDLECFAE